MRARRLLEIYVRRMSALRMIARGVSPTLVAPLEVTDLDLATAEKTAANVLGMMPLFLLMAVFMGGLHLAIDSTAGERERGSLEPLLVNPVRRGAVAVGKWLAVVAAAVTAIVVALLGFMLAIARVPLQDLGIKFHLGAPELIGMLLACVPLAFFAAALEMTAALFARTFKEAQTYLSMMLLVPIIPAAFVTLQPIKTTLPALLAAAPRGRQRARRRRLGRARFAALGKIARERFQVMLHPAFFVLLHLAGRQLAVADAHARPAARRLELDHHARVAILGREFAGAPGLHDPLARVDAEQDSVDVSFPGGEPAAAPRLDDGLAAAGERRVLFRVQPGRENALRFRGDDHLELERIRHPVPWVRSLTKR